MLYLFPLIIIAVGVMFRMAMTRQFATPDRAIDFSEIFFYVILIYGFVPGVGFMLAGYGVAEIQDSRLSRGYEIANVEYIQQLFLLLIVGFAVAYKSVRKPVLGKIDHSAQSAKLVKSIIPLALFLALFMNLLGFIWGGDIGEDYISGALQFRSAPLFLQQIASVASYIQIGLTIAAVTLALAAWPRRHIFVLAALIVNITLVILAGGSRTSAFLSFIAYVLSASIYVQNFKIRGAAIFLAVGLVAFLFAGLLRDDSESVNFLDIFFRSEFTAVFVTPVDLVARFAGEQAPFNIYTVDFLRLIPAQLLPFTKVDPAVWYASEFYQSYYESGGGFGFGILSEIVIGQGLVEAFVRGLILGTIFALLANRLHHANSSPIKIVAYVWITVMSYFCYRDTNFSIIARAFYQLMPVLIFLFFIQSKRDRGRLPKARRRSI